MKRIYATALTTSAALLATFLVGASSQAANQEIRGFHFSTCSDSQCLELWADVGLMSQLQFSFSTTGQTRVTLRDLKTGAVTTLEGSNASYLPNLDCITLEQTNGSSAVISVNTFKVEKFPGLVSADVTSKTAAQSKMVKQ